MIPASVPFYPPPPSAVPFHYSLPYPPPSSHQAPLYHRYPISGEPAASQHPQNQQQQHPYFTQSPSQQQQQPRPPPLPASVSSTQRPGLGQPPPANQQNDYTSSTVHQHATAHSGPGNNDLGVATFNLDGVSGIHQAEDADEDNDPEDGEGAEEGPIFQLPAPPEETYPCETELERAMHAWSLEHGYELVKRASKKNAQGQIYKRYFHCSKHGSRSKSKPMSETRKRSNRKSNRTGCPMSVASVAIEPANPAGQWQIRHRKSHHNHGPMDGLALAGHRRRARGGDVEKAVDSLFAIGTTTGQVLQFLQKAHPNGLFTRTDVANMKLKWKKNGTCADRGQRPENMRQNGEVIIACSRCRQKHEGCSKERPTCRSCAVSGAICIYEDEPQQPQPIAARPEDDGPAAEESEIAAISNEPHTTVEPGATLTRQAPPTAEQLAKTQEILANLRTFQKEHVTPRKLHLASSSVEVLAQSSCGTGNSYRSIPILYQEQDWPSFRDAMTEAARRENHHEVLIGDKVEPSVPIEPISNQNITEVEDWNEYIRQLAIFNRRNDLLLAALSSKLALNFRSRVHTFTKARDVWAALEELCLPRGSRQAYNLYDQLHSITLAESTDLNDYVGRLETTYAQFKLLKLNQSSSLASTTSGVSDPNRPRVGADVLPDESMSLLFLRNLGPAWKQWTEGLLATNNIAGFGTGQRVGFRDICRRAVSYEAMQRQTRDV